jgi:hypothetical protein
MDSSSHIFEPVAQFSCQYAAYNFTDLLDAAVAATACLPRGCTWVMLSGWDGGQVNGLAAYNCADAAQLGKDTDLRNMLQPALAQVGPFRDFPCEASTGYCRLINEIKKRFETREELVKDMGQREKRLLYDALTSCAVDSSEYIFKAGHTGHVRHTNMTAVFSNELAIESVGNSHCTNVVCQPALHLEHQFIVVAEATGVFLIAFDPSVEIQVLVRYEKTKDPSTGVVPEEKSGPASMTRIVELRKECFTLSHLRLYFDADHDDYKLVSIRTLGGLEGPEFSLEYIDSSSTKPWYANVMESVDSSDDEESDKKSDDDDKDSGSDGDSKPDQDKDSAPSNNDKQGGTKRKREDNNDKKEPKDGDASNNKRPYKNDRDIQASPPASPPYEQHAVKLFDQWGNVPSLHHRLMEIVDAVSIDVLPEITAFDSDCDEVPGTPPYRANNPLLEASDEEELGDHAPFCMAVRPVQVASATKKSGRHPNQMKSPVRLAALMKSAQAVA